MPGPLSLALVLLFCLSRLVLAASFDAAPFALPLPGGGGLLWEDPREIHRVVVHFEDLAPEPQMVRLEYWGSRWPEQRLPKDREPGGGDVGWMELGNWHRGGWRVADAEAKTEGSTLTFLFRPVNAKEFPELKGYAAEFRYTLKLRVSSETPLPKIKRVEAFTDSSVTPRQVRFAWKKPPARDLRFEAFNGEIKSNETLSPATSLVSLQIVVNSDPNTFDRTLLTVHNGNDVFTIRVDDLAAGPLFMPEFGIAALAADDARDYDALASEQKSRGSQTLYDQVKALPEQTWQSAWTNMPPKKSRIYFPLGLDGGRQRFLLEANGDVRFRLNDHYLRARPGKDTPRLQLEPGDGRFKFSLPAAPAERMLEEQTLPICETAWETGGVRIIQTAFVTELEGARADGNAPPADACAVFMAQVLFTNVSAVPQVASLPLSYQAAATPQPLRVDEAGFVRTAEHLRGQVVAPEEPAGPMEKPQWKWTLAPGASKKLLFKLPYIVLTEKAEEAALGRLDFEKELTAVAGWWRRRLDESAQLLTPEPVLDEFYRAAAGHLLVNCEREPNSTRRFARVGSFSYGAYGNESCMMVADLDRRGYHREAEECLDAWLYYQGTVALPGDFGSQAGVLYGAGGYEAGGYNQHHGWILWCLAEHYRFTRDQAWLRTAAPGILAGAEWIIRETRRTAQRHPLERGLLPAGSLEDIGDWWTWLSTSCYTWRGLDSAAWALEQVKHPQASRVRRAADDFRIRLLANFGVAAQRSPVVRLRDGTAVPHFPSQVHRRGRSFGWICETLEGSLHLLITGVLDSHSPEADWIVKDYEDNLFLSNQYGYTLDDFDKYWFGRGGMSMQACLLLDVEPYLNRDDVKPALRAAFNAIAVSHFPDVHMNTEHALPNMGDWRGDHFKTSDEANACGWLRQLFVREQGNELLLGQAVPREWLRPGRNCGLRRAATYFGPASVIYSGSENQITAQVEGPTRNPPERVRVRFRTPTGQPLRSVALDGKEWAQFSGEWVDLPGNIGKAVVVARY